jgi:chromosome segregation ATPase
MESRPVSHRWLIGPAIVLLKRLARKSVRWYVAPALQELHDQLAELNQQLLDENHLTRNQMSSLHEQWRAQITAFESRWRSELDAVSATLQHAQSSQAEVASSREDLNARVFALEQHAARLHQRVADLDGQRLALHASLQAQFVSWENQWASRHSHNKDRN